MSPKLCLTAIDLHGQRILGDVLFEVAGLGQAISLVPPLLTDERQLRCNRHPFVKKGYLARTDGLLELEGFLHRVVFKERPEACVAVAWIRQQLNGRLLQLFYRGGWFL